MIINYLKITFRNIFKQKGYSLINIVGLAIGISVCLLIMIWVQDELKFDRFHSKSDNIYQAFLRQTNSANTFHFLSTPAPLAPALKNNYPQVENACRYLNGGGKQIAYKENGFSEKTLRYVDPAFLEMFSYPLITQDQENPLKKPFSIIITEKIAIKYFGSLDVIGKILRIDNLYDFNVTGVLKNIPKNSTYQFGLLIPFTHAPELLDDPFNRWDSNWGMTFVQLKQGVDYREFQGKITGIVKQHIKRTRSSVLLTPYTKLHLYTLTGEDAGITYVYLFTIISFFVLLIACINFMNLSTARSSKRAKEIGLRKVVGAKRNNLIVQFFGESFVFVVLASFVAFCIAQLLLPLFNNLAAKELTLNIFQNFSLLVMLFSTMVVSGIISGIYPALYLSSFKPAVIVKGVTNVSKKTTRFRKTLVILQFTLSIGLIICTTVIFKQIGFMKNKPLGYNKEHLAYINLRGDSKEKYETTKNEFLTDPQVIQITATSKLPVSSGNSSSGYTWEGKSPDLAVLINTVFVDYNYLEVMGMKLEDGNDFLVKNQESKALDPQYILNQEAVRLMGIKDPVNKWFSWNDIKKPITGIVKDFNFASLQKEIEPMLIVALPQYADIMLVRVKSENLHRTINSLQTKWNRINPQVSFNLHFLDETLDNLYRAVSRVGNLAKYFTFLAIFIACLGLFGLASFITEQRKKEVGIRKTLGATTSDVIYLVIKDFLRWVLIANILAFPIAYIAVKNWLRNFAYKTPLGPEIFLISTFLAFFMVIVAVGYQSAKAAYANPVDSLKCE